MYMFCQLSFFCLTSSKNQVFTYNFFIFQNCFQNISNSNVQFFNNILKSYFSILLFGPININTIFEFHFPICCLLVLLFGPINISPIFQFYFLILSINPSISFSNPLLVLSSFIFQLYFLITPSSLSKNLYKFSQIFPNHYLSSLLENGFISTIVIKVSLV